MRGEKKPPPVIKDMIAGSSPHARGKGRDCGIDLFHIRIIPACAGKSYR